MSDERPEDLTEILVGFASTMLRARDNYTASHQAAVSSLAVRMAEKIGRDELSTRRIKLAGLVHDIGKIIVPLEILSRPGRLNPYEFELMKQHVMAGYEILSSTNRFEPAIADIVLQHHERLDGSGYPNGIAGSEITAEARILAVADVCDAMLSHRPYRPGLGISPVIDELNAGAGVIYDPTAVEVALEVLAETHSEAFFTVYQ